MLLPKLNHFAQLKTILIVAYILCPSLISGQALPTWKNQQQCGACRKAFVMTILATPNPKQTWTIEPSTFTYSSTLTYVEGGTGLAITRSLDTELYLSVTVSTSEQIALPAQVTITVDRFLRSYDLNDYPILSATFSEYSSWQEVWSEGVCVDVCSVVTLNPIDTFLPADFGVQTSENYISYNQAFLSSAILSQIDRPVCTRSVYTRSVYTGFSSGTGLPTSTFPLQTSISYVDTSSLDAELSQAAKISLGIAIAIGSGLIFTFLAFFVWRRRSKHQILEEVRRCSTSAVFQGRSEALSKSKARKHHLRSKTAHWIAPLAILGGLLSGIALAVGHHLMYNSITGQAVDDHRVSQSWILRFGTLLAFLVRVSFGISAGVAFSQLQWLEIRRRSLTVGEIDTVSNILSDILNFVHTIWLHLPVLTLLGIIWWLLLLVPVLTPGTLNVVSLAHRQSLPLIVPQFNMSTDWIATLGHYASPPLTKILLSTALGGQILSSPPIYPNQSFQLSFFAPAVDCRPANASITTLASMLATHDYSYLAWTGSDYWMVQNEYPLKVDYGSTDVARLYIAFFDSWGPGTFTYNSPIVINGIEYPRSNVTECLLYNSSYSVNFTYQNSELYPQVLNISFVNYVSFGQYEQAGDFPAAYNAYLALLWGLGDLLVGAVHSLSVEVDYSTSPEYTLIDLLPDLTNSTVIPVVKELFQNMTLSVLTSGNSLFTKNETVIGEVTAYRTAYAYNPLELLMIYGLAFLLTLLCSAIGFYAFLVNGGSYRNVFSTFIRVTKSCNFPIEEDDTGFEPRPKSLNRTPVNIIPKPRLAEEEVLVESVPIPPTSIYRALFLRKANPTD